MELSGYSAIHTYIKEDQNRRKEPDYIHTFPGIYLLITNIRFELIANGLIFLNLFMLVQQLNEVDRYASRGLTDFLDKFFTLVFTFEWILRVLGNGWTALFEKGSLFDTTLVLGFGFLPQFIFPAAGIVIDAGSLRSFTALRALRVARLAAAFKTRQGFQEAWEIINGFMNAASTVVWTMVLTCLLVFCFGVLSLKIFGQSETFRQEWHDVPFVMEYFGSVPKAMLSMFQTITLDGYSENIVRRLTSADNDTMTTILSCRFFFMIYLLLTNYIVMNTVMGILVEKVFSGAKQDEQMIMKSAVAKKEEELSILTELFLDLDKDQSGDLSKTEFYSALDKDEHIRKCWILFSD